MASILQFTLGLSAGGFLGPLASADAKVKGFIGSLVGLGAMTAGVAAAFERGAGLEHLSKRTGASVKDLYSLQQGFKAAGLSADDVAPSLWMMQRALGGVDEMGQSTADVFRMIGLSAGELKRQGPTQQFEAILKVLGRLNQSDAAKASSAIFGRMNGASMLQLARSSEEFAEAIGKSAEQAALFQRNAAAFDKLEQTFRLLKDKGSALFAGIAAGLVPALQQVGDEVNKIDLSRIGHEVGSFGNAMAQAFNEAKLSELIGETFRVGFDLAVAFAPASFVGIGQALLKTFETPLVYLQAGMEHVLYRATWAARFPDEAAEMDRKIGAVSADLAKKMGPFGVYSGDADAKRQAQQKANEKIATIRDEAMQETFQKTLAEAREGGLRFDLGSGEFGLKEMGATRDALLAQAKASAPSILAPLQAMVEGLTNRASLATPVAELTGKPGTAEGSPGDTNLDRAIREGYKPQFTSWERMGFVLSGATNPALDHARRTADNTGRAAELLEVIAGGGAGNVIHQPI